MDDQRFDRIARMLGTAPTRRGALQLLLGGVLGGLLGGAGQTARAVPPECDPIDPNCNPCEGVVCEPANECQESTCDPTNGECLVSNVTNGSSCATGICCNGNCIQQSPGNCGCLAVTCPAGTCTIATCSGSPGTCGQQSVSNGTNTTSCPNILNACKVQACRNGQCVIQNKTDNSDCGSEGKCCSGTCRNTQTDNNNCGACGTICEAGQTCLSGNCAAPPPACQTGLKRCNERCVNSNTDERNCGRCGKRCGRGERCRRGRCRS